MMLTSYAIGFSIGAALLLILALSSIYRELPLPRWARGCGYLMLLAMISTQLQHQQVLQLGLGLGSGSGSVPDTLNWQYVLSLALQSSGFYGLFLGLLRAQARHWPPHLALPPLGCALAVAAAQVGEQRWGVLLCMASGGGGALYLGHLVYQLRSQRRWFALEVQTLLLFAAMAVLIALLGLLSPQLGWQRFAASFSWMISLSFGLVLYLLLRFPDLPDKAVEAVGNAYAISTLSNLNLEQTELQLRELFEQQHIYKDENLNLTKVADLLEINAHQLSELVNSRFQVGFSRLVRNYRVEAAQKMLIDEPRASVLSVGLSVGFTTQSNFYVAFKSITGMVPGQFRKQHLLADG